MQWAEGSPRAKFGRVIAGPLFTESGEPVTDSDSPRTIALLKSTMRIKFMLVGLGWLMY